jgi:predicted ATP-dependent endonuclease of OLD family
MKLLKVVIHKYKCIESDQIFDVEDDISILVGMNESGKTSALEAIAKSNYFQDDKDYKYNLTHDFPRREKKKAGKSGVVQKAVTLTYSIDSDLKAQIEEILGPDVFNLTEVKRISYYDNTAAWLGIDLDYQKYIEYKLTQLNISDEELITNLLELTNQKELNQFIENCENWEIRGQLTKLKLTFREGLEHDENTLNYYFIDKLLERNLPKFMYYDEYYSLPSRININELVQNKLSGNARKTATALFELADINTEDLLNSEDFEDYIAELEATEAIITEELFNYWKTNKNLSIVFRIDPSNNQKVLDIRVKNKGVSLPLRNRSKGFNWFFSFLVWFKKIQESPYNNYILLLDEPGLNLHASAQHDLLTFLEDLSEDYQVVFTTHSPFMIPSGKLHRVRTVLETDKGSFISDTIQEKDPNTLFPLQAALGYDIAQNLFVSPKNLLVEGVSDLMYLQVMSGVLEGAGRKGLNDNITIVPTGGLEKVATFISLLRGSKLKIACLLDSYTDAKGKAKMDKLIRNKIINGNKIRFFDQFVSNEKADIEDLFHKEDYLKLFNEAFQDYEDFSVNDLNSKSERVIIQLNKKIDGKSFNHYRPANVLTKKGADIAFFKKESIDSFEKVFEEINRILK